MDAQEVVKKFIVQCIVAMPKDIIREAPWSARYTKKQLERKLFEIYYFNLEANI
jgi:hypothetical protein